MANPTGVLVRALVGLIVALGVVLPILVFLIMFELLLTISPSAAASTPLGAPPITRRLAGPILRATVREVGVPVTVLVSITLPRLGGADTLTLRERLLKPLV